MGSSKSLGELFVGSTSKDLDKYRLGVSDALFKRVKVRAHLSEDWDTDHVPTVDECRRRLEECHGYLGLFGYYYGWIPTGHQESITHMEYRWAMEKWSQRRPARVAVFLPGDRHPTASGGKPCEAEKELRDAAEVLVRSYPSGKKVHQQKLATFLDEVSGQGRTCNFFSSLSELRELVIVTGQRWKGGLAAAARAPASSPPQGVSDEQLGLLGRNPQTEALKDVLAQVRDRRDAPAACVVASGSEEAGQAELLAALCRLPELRRGRPPVKGRPPLTTYDVPELIAWFGRQSCAPEEHAPPVETITQLAQALHRTLRAQDSVLLLDRIERLRGGLARFCTDFWGPLLDELQSACAKLPVAHHLFVAVATYAGSQQTRAGLTVQWDAHKAVDSIRTPICLPELAEIDRKGLSRWLNDVGVDASPSRVDDLAKAVLADAEGHPDGTPLHVYRRLKGEQLW